MDGDDEQTSLTAYCGSESERKGEPADDVAALRDEIRENRAGIEQSRDEIEAVGEAIGEILGETVGQVRDLNEHLEELTGATAGDSTDSASERENETPWFQ